MKKFLSVLVLGLGLSSSAFAGEVAVDLTGPRCTVTQLDDGSKTATTSACSTANTLPSVRYDAREYSLYAQPDLNGGSVGVSSRICPGFELGVRGGASSAKSADAETHKATVGAFSVLRSSAPGGRLETTLGVDRTDATGAHDAASVGLDAKWLLNGGGESWSPFLGLGGSYSEAGDVNAYTGSASFGVRASL